MSTSTKGTVAVNTAALKKPNVVQAIDKLKKDKIAIQVVEETDKKSNLKLEYLSEVEDSETGEISKPFTIGKNKYQMVRTMSEDRKKGIGVYSFNEVDDDGNNKIYDIKEFEENIAKKHIEEEGVVEPEGREAVTLNTETNVIDKPAEEVNPQSKADEVDNPSFAGFKHFIVNKKTGKARKFKGFEDLAKAKMSEDEQYMGVKDFKKYVDEALFGKKKKDAEVVTEVAPTGEETDEEMNVKAERLMAMIAKKIPEGIIKTIKTPIAQREVIAAFAEMIGVPRNGLSNLISGIKDLAKSGTNKPQPIEKGTQPTLPATQPVTERRIIKIKDL
jgi:hypothetical protein